MNIRTAFWTGAVLCGISLGAMAQDTQWSARSDMPSAREKTGACAIGRYVYVVGGATAASQPGLDNNERYDTLTDSWATRQAMPTPRRELTAAAAGGSCYAIGGSAGFGSSALSVVEAYDPASNQWTARASMPTARFYPASAVIDGMIYVAGGGGNGNAILATLEAYDPATNQWDTLPSMPTARAAAAAAALDGKLFVIGGTNNPASQRFNDVEVYDSATRQWSAAAPLPQALAVLSARSAGGRIYVVGGSNAQQGGSNMVYAYDPAGDRWAPAVSLPSPRAMHSSAVVDGRLHVFGGALSTSVPHPAVASVFALGIGEPVSSLPINVGMADAWYDPAKAGQGFFITVFPDARLLFLAWFTFDTQRPPQDVMAMLGEPGHRWLTAQGPYQDGVGNLDVVLSSGGVFDTVPPLPSNDANYGEITLRWPDCATAQLHYELPGPSRSGEIELQRVAGNRASLCQELQAGPAR